MIPTPSSIRPTVKVQSEEEWNYCISQAGSIEGEFNPAAGSGTVVFGTYRGAAQAAAAMSFWFKPTTESK